MGSFWEGGGNCEYILSQQVEGENSDVDVIVREC